MKAVIQRVNKAGVNVNGLEKREIGRGLVVLLAVGKDDTASRAKWLADKVANLRIFPDDDGKFDKSVLDISGEILVISQFTLYGDAEKGRRPDFTKAAEPKLADELYREFITYIKAHNLKVETGEFAADMLVEIHNNGPVTILLEKN
jgi:D-aminoacyl-tRNA deacylase